MRALTLGALLLGATALGCGGGSSSPGGGDGGAGGEGGGSGDGGGGGGDAGDAGKTGDSGGGGDGGAHPEGGTTEGGTGDGGTATGLHVVMGTGGQPGHIVDGSGTTVILHGADRSGTEYSCLGGGFFDGPADQTGIDAMKTWKINAVRVPLNADCWLGVNGVPTAQAGAKYQSAISTWVNLITSNGMVAILDLHWTAPGTYLANAQVPMADADHAPTFWSQVAKAYAGNGSVIFDLFNEPYITDWACWTSGGTCAQWNGSSPTGSNYTVAGMAALLQAVRKAGANNVVILGGLAYSSDMSSWVSSVQSIPGLAAPLSGISIANVAASWHAYDFNSQQSGCPSQYNGYSGTCNTAAVTAANTSATKVFAAGFPIVLGETGISAYSASTAASFSAAGLTSIQGWLDGMLTYMEGQGQGYLGWSWNTDTPPVLVTDYTGTATPYFGATYKAHLSKY
ncbi:MAG TPA: cellulase family glycosylhydrolase [Polyangiaceae bacterium]|jgi:hypothetical protein